MSMKSDDKVAVWFMFLIVGLPIAAMMIAGTVSDVANSISKAQVQSQVQVSCSQQKEMTEFCRELLKENK